ncbi:hypothetical protein BKI52_15895 [marine bacterium AO1-C]|nr:hypothetical protein BKI52_15895 [marine bacterium AO1-C]
MRKSNKKFEVRSRTASPSSANQSKFFQIRSSYDLSRVIKTVASGTKPKDATEQVLRVDKSTKKVKKRHQTLMGAKHLVYQWVSTKNTAKGDKVTHIIENFSSRENLKIEVRYEASCTADNVAKVATSLAGNSNPGEVLHEFIDGVITNYVQAKREAGIEVIRNFFELKQEFQEEIRRKVETGIGLTFGLLIDVANINDADHLEIKSASFAVKVSDYHEDIPLSFDIGLEIDDHNKIQVYTSQVTKIEGFVKKEIKGLLLKEVNLNQLCFALDDEVVPKVVNRLNTRLEKYGRKVAYLKLDAKVKVEVPKNEQVVTHQVNCKLRGYPHPVVIENRVRLTLEDVSKFNRAGISNLERWMKQCLEEVIALVFFDRTYVNILLDLKEDEAEVKHKINDRASAIGFSVDHIFVRPNLKELELTEGFQIKFDEYYHTKDHRVAVSLQTILEANVENLRDIKDYLNPNVDFKEKIKKTVRGEIERYLHTIDPERAYMQFFQGANGEQSVEEVIRQKVQASLTRFHLSNIYLTLKPLETEITSRFTALQKGFHSFYVEFLPIRDEGEGDKVRFKTKFKVLGIHPDGWHTFQANGHEVEEEIGYLVDFLRDDLKERLETISNFVLRYNEYKGLQEIKKVAQMSLQEVVRVFGLVIEIVGFRRETTTAEQQAIETTEDYHLVQGEIARERQKKDLLIANNHELETYEKLLKQKERLIEQDYQEDDDELKVVRARLQEIEQKSSLHLMKKRKKSSKTKKNAARKKFNITNEFNVLPPEEQQNNPEIE